MHGLQVELTASRALHAPAHQQMRSIEKLRKSWTKKQRTEETMQPLSSPGDSDSLSGQFRPAPVVPTHGFLFFLEFRNEEVRFNLESLSNLDMSERDLAHDVQIEKYIKICILYTIHFYLQSCISLEMYTHT